MEAIDQSTWAPVPEWADPPPPGNTYCLCLYRDLWARGPDKTGYPWRCQLAGKMCLLYNSKLELTATPPYHHCCRPCWHARCAGAGRPAPPRNWSPSDAQYVPPPESVPPVGGSSVPPQPALPAPSDQDPGNGGASVDPQLAPNAQDPPGQPPPPQMPPPSQDTGNGGSQVPLQTQTVMNTQYAPFQPQPAPMPGFFPAGATFPLPQPPGGPQDPSLIPPQQPGGGYQTPTSSYPPITEPVYQQSQPPREGRDRHTDERGHVPVPQPPAGEDPRSTLSHVSETRSQPPSPDSDKPSSPSPTKPRFPVGGQRALDEPSTPTLVPVGDPASRGGSWTPSPPPRNAPRRPRVRLPETPPGPPIEPGIERGHILDNPVPDRNPPPPPTPEPPREPRVPEVRLPLTPDKTPKPAPKPVLNIYKESAAALGDLLSTSPNLDNCLEGFFGRNPDKVASIMGPNPQDALISKFQETKTFKGLFGPSGPQLDLGLNTHRESAAAWGAILPALPNLDDYMERRFGTNIGKAFIASVKDPNQQDDLIAKWRESKTFKFLLGQSERPPGSAQEMNTPKPEAKPGLSTNNESAAVLGAILGTIPNIEALVQDYLRGDAGNALITLVKDPNQQDALISRWHESVVFRAFFGDNGPPPAPAQEKDSPKPVLKVETKPAPQPDPEAIPKPAPEPSIKPAPKPDPERAPSQEADQPPEPARETEPDDPDPRQDGCADPVEDTELADLDPEQADSTGSPEDEYMELRPMEFKLFQGSPFKWQAVAGPAAPEKPHRDRNFGVNVPRDSPRSTPNDVDDRTEQQKKRCMSPAMRAYFVGRGHVAGRHTMKPPLDPRYVNDLSGKVTMRRAHEMAGWNFLTYDQLQADLKANREKREAAEAEKRKVTPLFGKNVEEAKKVVRFHKWYRNPADERLKSVIPK